MKALEIIREKNITGDLIIEMVVWRVPVPVAGSSHNFKYRLYCGRAGRCLVRYDNERGKGDHAHYSSGEQTYHFISLERLLADFEADVERLAGDAQ